MIGDKKEIKFWEDKWVVNETLMYKYPKLYSIAVDCDCSLVQGER